MEIGKLFQNARQNQWNANISYFIRNPKVIR